MIQVSPAPAARLDCDPVAATAPTAFVIDDDEAVRDSLQLLLEADGFDVAAFPSGAAALAVLETARPACLVLDLHMPGSSGLDLLHALAVRPVRIPVVVISGRIDRATKQRALAAGAGIVLEKPLAGAELIEAIRRLLRDRRPEPTGHIRTNPN
jgi:two-component system response regulator FixJ